MHEFSLIQSIFKIIEQVAQANNLQTISKIRLKIGKLRQVAPDFLQFAFAAVAKGTLAEGAALISLARPKSVILTLSFPGSMTMLDGLMSLCIIPLS